MLGLKLNPVINRDSNCISNTLIKIAQSSICITYWMMIFFLIFPDLQYMSQQSNG